MLGDNMYGGQKAEDFVKKFETPYKPLLDGGVKFFASLGNHDDQNNRFYPLWNMNGERYYTYKQGDVRFFVLDSDYMDPKQLAWLEQQLTRLDRATGRSPISIIRCIPRPDGTDRRSTSGSSSSRCFSSTA